MKCQPSPQKFYRQQMAQLERLMARADARKEDPYTAAPCANCGHPIDCHISRPAPAKSTCSRCECSGLVFGGK